MRATFRAATFETTFKGVGLESNIEIGRLFKRVSEEGSFQTRILGFVLFQT